MSETIDLYKGQIYTLPKQPPKKEILNWDLPQKQQKWKRTELPDNWDELSDEEQLKFAEDEDRKCTDGIWLFINGVSTYITGDHYFYVNWFMIDSGYPDYRDRDRRWFYHWKLCEGDEDCLGQMYGKHRRDGYSYRVDSCMLNDGRRTFNANYGIISKTGEDAKEMFNKLVHGFIELPSFFKPQVQSAEDVKKELVLKTPQKRVSYKNRKTEKEISLNTRFDWRNTKENAYDGMKLRRLASDESAKNPVDVSIIKWFNIAKTCLVLGSRIIGKIFMGSTVNEIEKGGEGFKDLWKNSLYSEKTENGRTLSGMYRYFITAADGLEGFIDEFGMSVIETPTFPVMGIDGRLIKKGASQWVLDELKARKDKGDGIGYYEFKRQFPLSEDDMFANPADENNPFDLEKIEEQRQWNDTHEIWKTLTCGYFQWNRGDRNTWCVEWIGTEYNDPKVKFRYSYLPKFEERNLFSIGDNGKRTPSNTHIAISTLDPFSSANPTDKRRASKAASHVFKKYDMMSPKNLSYVFVGEYYHRPPDPLEVYEDMVMQCVFWGIPLLVEKNLKSCRDYFVVREMDNYLMMPPAMTEQEYISNLGTETDAGQHTNPKTQVQMIDHLASYIYNNIGYSNKTGDIGYMPFNRTLEDWTRFEVKKWTPYDLTISSMLSVVAANAVTMVKEPEQVPMRIVNKYRLQGNNSVKVKYR